MLALNFPFTPEHAAHIRRTDPRPFPCLTIHAVEDGKVLRALVRDWRAGKYRQAFYGTIAAVVFGLLYVINPFDIVPDVLPVIGALDDATVIGALLMLVERDLKKYRTWKEGQGMIEDGKR
jgi:uncharacterized membrane protein YkvA (DUF1232 family)